MNITQTLRVLAFFIGAVIVASGFTDLSTLGNVNAHVFLSNGGNGVLKVVVGLILMTLGAKPSFVLTIVNLTFGQKQHLSG